MITNNASPILDGRRVHLRLLCDGDFDAWRQVRRRCRDWVTKWEPRVMVGQPDVVENKGAYVDRCGVRDRERQMGVAYGFGVFINDELIGEISLSNVQRGPFQSGHIGYWIDQQFAGQGYAPEMVVVILRFAFEELGLHRLQISIVPRNSSSRRVVQKLGLRDEGVALRYLEINGVWEDHICYAITEEEWKDRGSDLVTRWVE